jgi:hypothetical protein
MEKQTVDLMAGDEEEMAVALAASQTFQKFAAQQLNELFAAHWPSLEDHMVSEMAIGQEQMTSVRGIAQLIFNEGICACLNYENAMGNHLNDEGDEKQFSDWALQMAALSIFIDRIQFLDKRIDKFPDFEAPRVLGLINQPSKMIREGRAAVGKQHVVNTVVEVEGQEDQDVRVNAPTTMTLQ